MIFAMGNIHPPNRSASFQGVNLQAISGHTSKWLNGSWRETSTWCTRLAQVQIKLTPFPSVWGSLMTVFPSDPRAFSLSYWVWVSSYVARNLDGSFSTSPKSAAFDFWFGLRTPMISICLDIPPTWHNRFLTHTIPLSCFLRRSSNLGVWQSASHFELQYTWEAAANDWGPAKEFPFCVTPNWLIRRGNFQVSGIWYRNGLHTPTSPNQEAESWAPISPKKERHGFPKKRAPVP